MPTWLQDETLRFFPLSGTFDEACLGSRILLLGHTFRDEADPRTYVVAETTEGRDAYAAQRHAYPDEGFPYTLLVEVTPERVLLTPPLEDGLRPMWEQVTGWLLETPCRVLNEFGTDLTAEFKAIS